VEYGALSRTGRNNENIYDADRNSLTPTVESTAHDCVTCVSGQQPIKNGLTIKLTSQTL
jgi:hypothetical protein